jgi:hypothetical protein
MKHLKLYNVFKETKLFESLESEMNFDKIVDILSTECSEFLELLEEKNIKGLYRGMSSAYLKNPIVDGFWKVIAPKNREPRDIKPEISRKIDQEFEKKFGTTLRNKGIFTTKDISIANDYGNHPFFYDRKESFLFFPKNGFKYFWNPKIDDLFTELRDYRKWYEKEPFFWNSSEQREFQEIINGYKEGEIEKVKSQELTFICDEYYMLDLDYYDKLIDYLF